MKKILKKQLELFNKIEKQFNEFQTKQLNKSKIQIFNNCYEIDFFKGIYNIIECQNHPKEISFTEKELDILNNIEWPELIEELHIFYLNLDQKYSFTGLNTAQEAIDFMKFYVKEQNNEEL